MSAETDHSSGGTSPLYSAATPQPPTQTVSSEEEDIEEEEYSEKEYLFPEEEEYLEGEEYLDEGCYLEEEMLLKGKEYLCEDRYAKAGEQLRGEEDLEEEYLFGKYVDDKFKGKDLWKNLSNLTRRPSQGTTFFTALPSISELTQESPSYHTKPSTSFMQQDGELPAWHDQSTQTKWIYKSKSATAKSKSKLKLSTTKLTTVKTDSDLEVCVVPDMPQQEESAMEFVSKESLWDNLLNEAIDSMETEDYNKVLNSSYQVVFKTILKEMAARQELEEDIDIPLTEILQSDTRRKLGILLKNNFGKYKQAILWILKKRGNILTPKTAEMSTFTFQLWKPLPEDEEPVIEAKKTHRVVHRKKTLEVDTEWIQNKTEVHQDDGKLILYPSGIVFQIIFPDGSGQIHYPSGNLALLIISTKQRKFTYIIVEDSEEWCVRALINNSGHATFYNENKKIWLSLSQNLGYYFPKGQHQKAWNWWNLNLHVHMPPVWPISLKINQYIKVQVRSQEEITFCFSHQKKHIRLNLGTKYKKSPAGNKEPGGAPSSTKAEDWPQAGREFHREYWELHASYLETKKSH
ncbi:glutamate-rich protein 6B [Suricata suricatta]|uniref:glutamate-rich protein 6B n=1 Tax=Suricata suricatta TaxID=37032 RepID=UPI001155F14C|nr:glutamate-rich protein 6B [Suricata suricatta]